MSKAEVNDAHSEGPITIIHNHLHELRFGGQSNRWSLIRGERGWHRKSSGAQQSERETGSVLA